MKSLLIIGLLVGFVLLTGCVNDSVPPMSEKLEIVSLERNMMIDGHIGGGAFLFSGYIESVPSYFYYIKLPNGGYKLKTAPAEECTIYMDEEKSPYILVHYADGHFASGRSGEYGDIGSEYILRRYDEELETDRYTSEKVYRYVYYYRTGDIELHIPPNSIVKEYKP